jgi:hypothetical protein
VFPSEQDFSGVIHDHKSKEYEEYTHDPKEIACSLKKIIALIKERS